MSASRRRDRRRVERARIRERLVEADNAPPVFLKSLGRRFEVWRCGRVLYVLPALLDSDPRELRDAIACRRAAGLTGTCCCGARRRFGGIDANGIASSVFRHEADCSADDESIVAMIKAAS